MPDLQSALSRIDEDLWRESASQRGNIMWLPLWLISDSGLWIGLDRQARWVVGRLPGQVGHPTERLSPSWLPLLNHDESVAAEELSFGAAKHNLPAGLLESVPIDDIIVLALTSNNAHWIDRALIWLESRKVRDDINEMLPTVVSSRSASQRARQRAKRLMGQG